MPPNDLSRLVMLGGCAGGEMVLEIKEEIRRRLAEIEAKEDVRILYACESGSRAWGFASRDSDWDVRFIYAHRNDWYLSIDVEKKRDVIELPISDDLDVNGWDVRKALWLYRKSNPPLLEWIDSPIVYQKRTNFIDRLRMLLADYYTPKTCHYHYISMAKKNYREYLRGENVRLKKYLYVLRPLLAVRWMEQEKCPAPVEFSKLLKCIELYDAKKEIEKLVERKINGDELDHGKRIDIINQFIESELVRMDSLVPNGPLHADVGPLNRLFRETLVEVWS
ncbi:MAG TPA: nucleotidyltransferase domain-containing protein [Desulfovibrio sp.]|jgi:predicted nucleotidyltransferase|uniref:nucleotidyltransferase domain-containing protein n=1 Tax=Desulfovibrio TaxID=872 RepID=UPI002A3EEEE3|nr:nucleotidyltransferase domain-containing protein [Desulfovibrio sp.]MDY0307184.1 nucleotidyltransferase domain-containing protein [Desulfovibrionaceae bacterium]HMM38391.1 nucleotidyltransferase domain-containing protein [Desulfovibrio sp.]